MLQFARPPDRCLWWLAGRVGALRKGLVISAWPAWMSCDLVVFVTREASLPGGSNLAVSRFIQQVEPTWQAAWCHKAEDHHIRTAQLSSKDADTAELSNHLLTRAVAVILLRYVDATTMYCADW